MGYNQLPEKMQIKMHQIISGKLKFSLILRLRWSKTMAGGRWVADGGGDLGHCSRKGGNLDPGRG